MHYRAFTLLEIIVVVIIVGILASLGIANYSGTKEKAIGKEAIANLKMVAAAEKVYRLETGSYYPADGSTISSLTTINSDLKLSLTDRNWVYSIVGGAGGGSFEAIANRQDAGSSYPNCEYYLRHNDSNGEPNKRVTADCP